MSTISFITNPKAHDDISRRDCQLIVIAGGGTYTSFETNS